MSPTGQILDFDMADEIKERLRSKAALSLSMSLVPLRVAACFLALESALLVDFAILPDKLSQY